MDDAKYLYAIISIDDYSQDPYKAVSWYYVSLDKERARARLRQLKQDLPRDAPISYYVQTVALDTDFEPSSPGESQYQQQQQQQQQASSQRGGRQRSPRSLKRKYKY